MNQNQGNQHNHQSSDNQLIPYISPTYFQNAQGAILYEMLAAKNEYLDEAFQTIYQMSAEERIRKQCRDREEYYQDLRSYERAIAERDNALAEQNSIISDCEKNLAEKEA